MTEEGRPLWLSSGFQLLSRDGRGRLVLEDDFLRAYLLRPELAPVEESCAAERRLHEALLETPRRPITPVTLLALKDPDARENYEVFARFRDHLMRHPTLEDAYLALFLPGAPALPPLFLEQMVHVIVRNMLVGREDSPLLFRAGECLFRCQNATVHEGAILLADEEIVERASSAPDAGLGSLGQLIAEAGGRPRAVELDILREDNARSYYERAERFDMVLDISFTRPGLDALCRVLEIWLRHMLDIETRIQPLQQVRDQHWSWHVGLDTEASALLNDLYAGVEVGEERLAHLLTLFRLEPRDPALIRPALRGKPIYLGLAMDAKGKVRLKPQNLLVNLPLAEAG